MQRPQMSLKQPAGKVTQHKTLVFYFVLLRKKESSGFYVKMCKCSLGNMVSMYVKKQYIGCKLVFKKLTC